MNFVRRGAQRLARAAGFDRLQQDIGYALRGLRRSPGFTTTVIVTFALGIGANAAIFSILDLVYLKTPEGVVRPSEVHRVYASIAMRGGKGERYVTEGLYGARALTLSERRLPRSPQLRSTRPTRSAARGLSRSAIRRRRAQVAGT